MNELFSKLVAKKKAEGKGISPVEKEASNSVLADLMDFLHGHDGEKLKGLKKVTVASNDPHGLEEGLAKAKEMVAQGHGADEGHDEDSEDEDMEDPEEEASETPEEEDTEEGHGDDEHSEDQHQEAPTHGGDTAELMKQIAELKAQLAAKQGPGRI